MYSKEKIGAYDAPELNETLITVESGFANSFNLGGGGTYGVEDTNDNGGY